MRCKRIGETSAICLVCLVCDVARMVLHPRVETLLRFYRRTFFPLIQILEFYSHSSYRILWVLSPFHSFNLLLSTPQHSRLSLVSEGPFEPPVPLFPTPFLLYFFLAFLSHPIYQAKSFLSSTLFFSVSFSLSFSVCSSVCG